MGFPWRAPPRAYLLEGNLPTPLKGTPLEGTSLALDLPQNDRLDKLFHTLDRLVLDAGGRLYPAKDAHMSAAMFQQCYPDWARVEELRDPALLSAFWKRVTRQEGGL